MKEAIKINRNNCCFVFDEKLVEQAARYLTDYYISKGGEELVGSDNQTSKNEEALVTEEHNENN